MASGLATLGSLPALGSDHGSGSSIQRGPVPHVATVSEALGAVSCQSARRCIAVGPTFGWAPGVSLVERRHR